MLHDRLPRARMLRARMLRVAAVLAIAATVGLVAPLAGPHDAAAAAPDAAAPDAAAPAAAAPDALAGVEDFTFSSLDVEYTLGRRDDGTSTLHVVETFTAEFPDIDQNRGMRRSIPDTYNGQPLHPRLVSITDAAGAPRPAETASDDGVYTMTSAAASYVHGTQVYVFTYELENVTWDFPDTGLEFYWDVNGVDWAQPFGEVTARVQVEPDLAATMTGRRACYAGYQGSTTPCEMRVSGDVVEATASDLGPRQTMTIALGFADGTFTEFDAGFFASPLGWLQSVAGVGLIGSIVWAGASRRRLRDEPGRPTIIAEYTPPPEIDALESALLLKRTTKAIPAEVLEQAVVGSIRIVEVPGHRWVGPKLQAELLDRSRADGDGRMLLDGLFDPADPPGTVFEFGRQDTRFSSQAQKVLGAANRELKRRGVWRRIPTGVRAWPIVLAVASAALVGLFGALALSTFVHPVVPIVLIAAAVPVLITVSALVSRTPLTAKGAEVRDHLLGLKLFIEWAEADRIRMLQSPAGAERVRIDTNDPRQVLRLYETLLPYAVVFGQERQWAAQLAVFYAGATPYWYVGTSGFDASSFSSGIGTLSASASSSSSTSGGSSGGGSAGGGGGGGGGGGV